MKSKLVLIMVQNAGTGVKSKLGGSWSRCDFARFRIAAGELLTAEIAKKGR
jgi:hypothetical protein